MSRRKPASSARGQTSAATRSPIWRNDYSLGAFLFILVALTYARVLGCGYIWDDNFHVTENATLLDLHGLWRIWFDVASTPQYYPLVHTSFWLEHHLWGLHAIGYHSVNLVLHALGAILLWRILKALAVRNAWLAAAIFALHPVQVESVAWISERKNVLSGVFYFSSALIYLRFLAKREGAEAKSRAWLLYCAALFLFVCALLSKTVTCSLPAALLLVVWWKSGKVKLRDIGPLVPFFAIGLALGWGTIWIERHQVGAVGQPWSLTFAERILIASRALWFYAGKLFWPAQLTFIYPRWQLEVSAAGPWIYSLGAVAVIVALWLARQKIGRGPLTAVLFFAGTLVPALGFVNVFPFRYSFVADHFQYLASLGLIVLAADGLARLPRFVPALLLATLATLTWRQIAIYRDRETLWGDTLRKNPESWMAQLSYATVLMQQGKDGEALPHLQRAWEIDPNVPETLTNLGSVLTRMGRVDEALPLLRKAVKIEPNLAAAEHYQLGYALMRKERMNEAIAEFLRALEIDPTYQPAESEVGNALLQIGHAQDSLDHLQRALALRPEDANAHSYLANTLLQFGRADEAVEHLEKVLQASPRNPDALKNMAWVLATWPDARVRDGAKAVRLAESANAETGGKDAIIETTLAAAYAETGRFAEAIATAQVALRLAEGTGNSAVAQLLRGQLALYRAGEPFRDRRPRG